jgi:hypothetical protein
MPMQKEDFEIVKELPKAITDDRALCDIDQALSLLSASRLEKLSAIGRGQRFRIHCFNRGMNQP